MIDRSQYIDLAQRRKQQTASRNRPNLELLGQAAVKAEILTGNEHWDTYLTFLQAAIERTMSQREQFASVLGNPMIVDDDEVRRARIAMIQCDERISAWRAAMSLPRDLIEKGNQAKDLLSRLEPDEPARA